jgi:nucleoside-diphosphate-sugar epimerase
MINVLITGAAGYIGAMLIDQLARYDSIGMLNCIDIKERPARLGDCAKLRWICADVAEDEWASEFDDEQIDVVIHCAYQIREMYGRGRDQQHRWNIDGARKVFEFALGRPSLCRLVQLSTVSAYGALPTNSMDRPLTEEAPLCENDYLYGVQKRQVETLLRQSVERLRPSAHVVVLRLASVSGPRGRFGLNRYGLLSTVAGGFPVLICGRADWGRQYLHEDDLVGVLSMFVHLPPTTGFQVFNVSPADFLGSAALGRLFDKRVVVLPPALLRSLFFLTWHGSRGAVTTPRGAWRFLTYPIRVDGGRLSQVYGYEYRYSSLQALVAQEGRYAPPSPALQPSSSGLEAS